MFLTVTLPSDGAVSGNGAPRKPGHRGIRHYEYQRKALCVALPAR
jgi:hypothetical protein